LEIGALELGDRKGDVEVEGERRGFSRDPDPIVLTDLLALRDDTKALDHLTGNFLLVKCSLQDSHVVHNVPSNLVNFQTEREALGEV